MPDWNFTVGWDLSLEVSQYLRNKSRNKNDDGLSAKEESSLYSMDGEYCEGCQNGSLVTTNVLDCETITTTELIEQPRLFERFSEEIGRRIEQEFRQHMYRGGSNI